MTAPLSSAQNVIFAHPNRLDDATLSGGNWLPSLPLENLQDRFLAHVARSAGLANNDTQILVDLGYPRPVRLLAMLAHNGSSSAQVQIIGADDAACTQVKVDTGRQDLWPTIFSPGTVEWEENSFWLGVPEAAERAKYPAVYTHIFDQEVVARYWCINIFDSANTDGWFEFGRLVVSPGWQPSWNMSLGVSLAVVDPSKVSESLGGAQFFDRRPQKRVARFALDHLDTVEAYERAFDMVQSLGRAGEVFVVLDPTDKRNLLRRAFLARVDDGSALQRPDKARHTMRFSLTEVVR